MAPESGASHILDPWRREVRGANAASYWPGPWSMRDATRGDQLIGRDDEAAAVTYAVLDHNLVVLTGGSGVGKTSLLHLKIIDELRERGFFVAVCDNWGDAPAIEVGDDSDVAVSEFLKRYLRASFEEQGVPIGDDDILTQLDRAYGSRAVIIFDQFEEVIRQRPAFFSTLQDWIERAVDQSQVRLLLSLRSEYAYWLSDLEVNPYRRQDIDVHVLNRREVVGEIIRAGRRADGTGPVIEESAIEALLTLWEESGATTRAGRIRLLHLQASLFVLWERAQRHADGVVTKQDVDNLEDRVRAWTRQRRKRRRAAASQRAFTSSAERRREQAVAFFDYSIIEVVRLFLRRSRKALEAIMEDELTERGMDDVLVEGVLGVLARMADHLSSGGYKVDQDHVHLAELALHDEIETLGFLSDSDAAERSGAEERARGIIRAFAEIATGDVPLGEGGIEYDWVSAPSRVLRAAVRSATEAEFPEPWVRDSVQVSAGPLMGQSPEAVLVEECRRYFLALEWLESGEFVRVSSTDDGSSVVALTHDGFGLGLNEWADDHDADMATDLHRITAAVGEVFQWPAAAKDVASVNDFTSDERRKVNKRFLNLRWRSCRVVGVHFERVVFMNCDFHGTEFERCSFEGVTFVNCVLNGVQFDHCEFIGTTVELEKESEQGRAGEDRMPSFVDDLAEEVRVLVRYSDTHVKGANVIFSAGAGIGAVPAIGTRRKDDSEPVRSLAVRLASDGDEIVATTTVDDQDGGLVIFGGRVSSVAFYGCTFPQDGEVSMRHVRGTSIDFFEHTGGRIELYDVYLRGVTVTTPVRGESEASPPSELGFQALESHLENLWFSTGLAGEADFQRTSVWQMFNGSATEAGGFRVRNGDENLNHFTGFIEADGSASAEAPNPEDVRRYADLIDYQPADSAGS